MMYSKWEIRPGNGIWEGWWEAICWSAPKKMNPSAFTSMALFRQKEDAEKFIEGK